jgi:predicted choloylglycine hydrolase
MRYLLEVAETVAEAEQILSRVPVHMAYNVTVLDRNADVATIFVAPGVPPQVTRLPVATNHPGTTPEDPEHARRFRSVERQDALLRALDSHPDVSTLVQHFLREPVYNNSYEEGFGTMYTAAYQPTKGVADFVWPTSSWARRFDSPSGTHEAVLGQTPMRRAPRPIDLIGARHSAPPGAGQ